MNPITIALMGLGGLGGFLGGSGGNRTIDPKLLARLFGPQALATDTQALYQTLLSSPAFTAIMNQASAQGTAAGNRARANFARAGLSSSGVGALGSAVSRGFGQNLILGARGNLWSSALNAAQQNLAARMGLYGSSYLQNQQRPTGLQQLGLGLSGAASTGLAALSIRQPKPDPTAPTPGTSVTTAPMRRLNDLGADPYHRPFSREEY